MRSPGHDRPKYQRDLASWYCSGARCTQPCSRNYSGPGLSLTGTLTLTGVPKSDFPRGQELSPHLSDGRGLGHHGRLNQPPPPPRSHVLSCGPGPSFSWGGGHKGRRWSNRRAPPRCCGGSSAASCGSPQALASPFQFSKPPPTISLAPGRRTSDSTLLCFVKTPPPRNQGPGFCGSQGPKIPPSPPG